MTNKPPHQLFHDRLTTAIQQSGETTYRLGHMVAAETDESPNAIRGTIERWLVALPASIVRLVYLLDVMGLELIIQRKK